LVPMVLYFSQIFSHLGLAIPLQLMQNLATFYSKRLVALKTNLVLLKSNRI